MSAVPRLHFRMRESGAQVFRVTDDARTRRLELDPLAVVLPAKDEIRPQGDRTPTPTEEAAMRDWMAARRVLEAERRLDDVRRLVDDLGRTAHWAQGRAADDALDAVTDDLLMAMHDLRTVLVRRKAEAPDRG